MNSYPLITDKRLRDKAASELVSLRKRRNKVLGYCQTLDEGHEFWELYESQFQHYESVIQGFRRALETLGNDL